MEKKDIDIVRGCQKFKEKFKYYSDSDKEAIIFLKLRHEGCPRKPALKFSSKAVCKSDSTRSIFGPPDYRILQVQQLPSYSLQKGWFQGNLNYKMDKGYQLSYKDILQEDIVDDNMQVLFNKNEEQAKEQFKKMLEITKQYFDEICQNYTVNKGNSNEEYLKSIQNFIQNTRKQLKTKTYFEYKNIKQGVFTLVIKGDFIMFFQNNYNRFYYLSSMLQSIIESEKESPEERESLIQKFNVFNDILRYPDIKNLDIKQEDNTHDEQSSQLISPSSRYGKSQQHRRQKIQNSKERLQNTSLSDNSMMMTLKSSPKFGPNQCSSSDCGYLPDLVLQDSLHQQTSLGPFDYMSSDSINSQEQIQSQEDKSMYGDSDLSPKSSSYSESSFKKSNMSFIHSAALQLQLLQQMDQTNQDLFSNSPQALGRVQIIEGSAESKRLLEQQFNEAQYFLTYQSQNKQSQDNKNQNKNQKNEQSKPKIRSKVKIVTNEMIDSKKKQISKFQSILKVDADIEKEFLKLAQLEQTEQTQQDEVQKQNTLQNQKSQENQPPPSPGTQKMSIFSRGNYVESSKGSLDSKSKSKDEKKIFNKTSSGYYINDNQLKQDVLNKTDSFNLNKLVELKKQMLLTFRKRNYKDLSQQNPFNKDSLQAPATKYFQTFQTKPNSITHQRNQTYSHQINQSLLVPAKTENLNSVSNLSSNKQSKENEDYFTMRKKYQTKKEQKSFNINFLKNDTTKQMFNQSMNDGFKKNNSKDQRIQTHSTYFFPRKQFQPDLTTKNSQKLSLSFKQDMKKTQNIFLNLSKTRKHSTEKSFYLNK